jgi:hypothetical protein
MSPRIVARVVAGNRRARRVATTVVDLEHAPAS